MVATLDGIADGELTPTPQPPDGISHAPKIEVDDAIDASGKRFDLELDPKTFAIVKRKAE